MVTQNTPLQNTPLQNTPLQNTPLQNTPLQNTPLQNAPLMNGVTPHSTPMQNVTSIPNRPPLPSQTTPGGPSATPVPRPIPPPPVKTPKSIPKPTSSSSLPAPPLDDVHAAFVEFRAKDEDKVSQAISRTLLLLTTVVSICAMHILQPDSSQEHKSAKTASTRVSDLSERHSRFHPGQQSPAYLSRR